MKYAIFSDLHANADALRRAIADAQSCGAEHFVCLGDIVGYGPLPAETLSIARSHCSVIVAGNHDDAVSGRVSTDDFIDLASDAVTRHRAELSAEDRAWLRSLPYTAAIEGAILSHGDFTDPKAFNYIQREEEAAANFAATGEQLLFVGHTHVPSLAITGESGRTYLVEPQDFELEDGKRYIVNPGSVGYPRERNGVCRSTYVLYDSAARSVVFRSLPFAVSSVLQRGSGGRVATRGAWWAAIGVLCLGLGALWITLAERPRSAAEETLAERPRSAAGETLAERPRSAVLYNHQLAITSGATKAIANLKVKRKSEPVTLTLRFLDSGGKELHREQRTVKSVCKRPFPIPESAATCVFTVTKTGNGEKRPIYTISPTIE